MSEVQKMSIEEFVNNIVLTIRTTDGYFFFKNFENGEKFFKLLGDKNASNVVIKDFLMANDSDIDREKLLVLIIKRAKEKIKDFEQELIEKSGTDEEKSIRAKINYIKNTLVKMKKMGSDIDIVIPIYEYNGADNEYQIEIIDSKKEINELKFRNEKAVKKFEQADNFFKEKNTGDAESEQISGIANIVMPILLTDLYEVFKPEEIAEKIRTKLVENDLINRGKKTYKEIEDLRSKDDPTEYKELTENKDYDYTILSKIKDCLKEYSEYLDFDKLLVICAYRFNSKIIENKISEEYMPSCKQLCLQILEYCKINNVKKAVYVKLQNPNKNCEWENIEFNLDEFEDTVSRIIDEKYYSKDEFEEFKVSLLEGTREIKEYEAEDLITILSKEEIDEIAKQSSDNLFYIATEEKWKPEKTLSIAKSVENLSETSIDELFKNNLLDEFALKELYLDGKISVEFLLRSISDENKLKLFIKPKDIIKQYKNGESEKLFKNLELLKKISEILDDEENLKIQREIVSNIKGNFSKKDINSVIAEMYKKGIISIKTIYEKCGEDAIAFMLRQGNIQVEDVVPLIKDKTISAEFLFDMYEKYVFDTSLGYEERLEIIRKGIISEETIVKLYKENYILKNDLDILLSEGLIRIKKYNTAISGKDIDKIKEEIPLNFDGLNLNLSGLKKIQYEEDNSGNSGFPVNVPQKRKHIIDEEARENFLKMFGACLVPDKATNRELNEDSPFYNYEFYIIPNKFGEIDSESIVIAERYYEDRDAIVKGIKPKEAVNNATYFFKLGDMPTFNKLKKKEVLDGRDGSIYRAKHILYHEKKNDKGEIEEIPGYWATGTLYGIAKTMLGIDLTKKSKNEIRIMVIDKLLERYGEDKLQEILNEIEKIDGGEYNCEISYIKSNDNEIR